MDTFICLFTQIESIAAKTTHSLAAGARGSESCCQLALLQVECEGRDGDCVITSCWLELLSALSFPRKHWRGRNLQEVGEKGGKPRDTSRYNVTTGITLP